MYDPNSIPTISALKQQAAALREELRLSSTHIAHSRSLELLSHKYGFKDWNCLSAAAKSAPLKCPVTVGDYVSGFYLGQPFNAHVKSVKGTAYPDRFQVSFHFTEPVDVVTFESFSSFRQRVSCTLNHEGVTYEKISNGTPHLRLNQ